MKKLGLLSMLLLGTVVVSCSNDNDDTLKDEYKTIELTRGAQDVVKPGNNLALATFEAISKKTNENFVFSPFGVNSLLATLADGDTGETRDELLQAFGLSGLTKVSLLLRNTSVPSTPTCQKSTDRQSA